MKEVWTSYAGSDAGELIDQLEQELVNSHKGKISLQRYMRRSELVHEPEKLDRSDSDDDPDKPFVSNIGPQTQTSQHVWYYLRVGESIKMLAQRIGAAREKVIILSPAYFQSRWCMAELAYCLRSNRSCDPVIVDKLGPGVLPGLLSGELSMGFALPTRRAESISLSDALLETLVHHEPDTADNSFSDCLKNLDENTFCSSDAAVISGSLLSLCEANLLKGLGAGKDCTPEQVFLRWMKSGLARTFNSHYKLCDAVQTLLPCWHGDDEDEESVLEAEVEVYDSKGNLIPLLDALAEFTVEQAAKGSDKFREEFADFIGHLAGFAALPLVQSAWLERAAVSSGGTQFVDSPNPQDLLLKGGLARAAIFGGGLRREFSGSDSDWPTPMGVEELMFKPSRGVVKSIDAKILLAKLHARFCAHTGAKLPTVWDSRQLETLRGRIRSTIKKVGKGCVALAIQMEQFDSRYNDWGNAAREALLLLNEGAKQGKEIVLDVLIIQHRPNSLDVFHDSDITSERMNLIKDILRLAP